MPPLRVLLTLGIVLGTLCASIFLAAAVADPPAAPTAASPAAATAAPAAAAALHPSAPRAARPLTLEQAVRMAEQHFKARVVRAEADHSGEHPVYVLRMLNERGRVWTVRVDASSGTLL